MNCTQVPRDRLLLRIVCIQGGALEIDTIVSRHSLSSRHHASQVTYAQIQNHKALASLPFYLLRGLARHVHKALTWIDQQVLWLDITMDDVLPMTECRSPYQFVNIKPYLEFPNDLINSRSAPLTSSDSKPFGFSSKTSSRFFSTYSNTKNYKM